VDALVFYQVDCLKVFGLSFPRPAWGRARNGHLPQDQDKSSIRQGKTHRGQGERTGELELGGSQLASEESPMLALRPWRPSPMKWRKERKVREVIRLLADQNSIHRFLHSIRDHEFLLRVLCVLRGELHHSGL